MTKDLEGRLEAAEMWYIRKIMRISWSEKKSNKEVIKLAGYKRSLLKTLRKRQPQFFVHNYKQSWWTRKANIERKD